MKARLHHAALACGLFLALAPPLASAQDPGAALAEPQPQYEKSMLIEIRGPNAPARPPTPEFLATQCEIIRSSGCLNLVKENLDLVHSWNMKDHAAIIDKLKRKLRVEVLSKTYLVRITASDPDPGNARDLASETVRAYRERRMADEARDRERELLNLREVIRQHEDAAAQQRLEMAHTKKGVNVRDERIKNIRDRAKYVDAKNRFESERVLLREMLRRLAAVELRHKLAASPITVLEDP